MRQQDIDLFGLGHNEILQILLQETIGLALQTSIIVKSQGGFELTDTLKESFTQKNRMSQLLFGFDAKDLLTPKLGDDFIVFVKNKIQSA